MSTRSPGQWWSIYFAPRDGTTIVVGPLTRLTPALRQMVAAHFAGRQNHSLLARCQLRTSVFSDGGGSLARGHGGRTRQAGLIGVRTQALEGDAVLTEGAGQRRCEIGRAH